MYWWKLWPEVVNDRSISNIDGVVAKIVTNAPYKELYNEVGRANIHQKLFHLFKHQALATSGMRSS
jgi:hypothetical protein